jgi:hypothetical protein
MFVEEHRFSQQFRSSQEYAFCIERTGKQKEGPHYPTETQGKMDDILKITVREHKNPSTFGRVMVYVLDAKKSNRRSQDRPATATARRRIRNISRLVVSSSNNVGTPFLRLWYLVLLSRLRMVS